MAWRSGRSLAYANAPKCSQVAIWPVGMIVLYIWLLIPCRFMILDEAARSPLLEATQFLHRDYTPA